MKSKRFILLLVLLWETQLYAKVVFPTQIHGTSTWTTQEQIQAIAIHHLKRTQNLSTHLIRLQESEVPHYHDRHDLQVVLLEGSSIIHFKDHQVRVEKGDVVFIPKGTFHWAENISPKASIVFATFSPPFDGKDKRLAE
jgi:mannose-6-phosphate isomerase-like protein (cupin superfamily)